MLKPAKFLARKSYAISVNRVISLYPMIIHMHKPGLLSTGTVVNFRIYQIRFIYFYWSWLKNTYVDATKQIIKRLTNQDQMGASS